MLRFRMPTMGYMGGNVGGPLDIVEHLPENIVQDDADAGQEHMVHTAPIVKDLEAASPSSS